MLTQMRLPLGTITRLSPPGHALVLCHPDCAVHPLRPQDGYAPLDPGGREDHEEYAHCAGHCRL